MSTDPYDDVLKRARGLSPERQRKLAEELLVQSKTTNGTADGRTVFDALSARGLIGFMSDGPGDLSTNPKHMEGFGKDAD